MATSIGPSLADFCTSDAPSINRRRLFQRSQTPPSCETNNNTDQQRPRLRSVPQWWDVTEFRALRSEKSWAGPLCVCVCVWSSVFHSATGWKVYSLTAYSPSHTHTSSRSGVGIERESYVAPTSTGLLPSFGHRVWSHFTSSSSSSSSSTSSSFFLIFHWCGQRRRVNNSCR